MNIRTGLQALAAGVVLLGTATNAEAATFTFVANLSGPAESPPNSSPGQGQATVVVDTVLSTLHVNTTFSDLLGTTTIAHIHCCTATPFTGTARPATTVPTFPGFPVGLTSGAYSNTFSLQDPTTYNPAFVAANGGNLVSAVFALTAGLLTGGAYFNIHTTLFPGGEIRGFLVPSVVPLPAAAPMLASALGIGALVGWRRKRAQRRAAAAA